MISFLRRLIRKREIEPASICAQHGHMLDFIDNMQANVVAWQDRKAEVSRAIDDLTRELSQLEQLLSAADAAMDVVTASRLDASATDALEAELSELLQHELKLETA